MPLGLYTYTSYTYLIVGLISSALAAEPSALNAQPPLSITVKSKKRKAPALSAYERPAQQIAQSTVQINNQALKQNGANRLDELVDTIPGVSLDFTNGQAMGLSIRGFALKNDEQLDGLPDASSFFLRDPATLERVEISKGRDSTVFGAGSLAGTVNMVSKKPSFKRQRHASVGVSTPQQTRVSVDVDTPLNNNWASRLVAVGQIADTDYQHVGDDRYTIMPSLRLQQEQQNLLLQAEHTWQNQEANAYTIWYDGAPVYNVSYVDPRAQSNRRFTSTTLAYERDLNPQWQAKLQLRQIAAAIKEKQISVLGNIPATDQLMGFYNFAQRKRSQQAAQVELKHTMQQKQWQHQTRLGWQLQTLAADIKQQMAAGTFYVTVHNPQFDFPLPAVDLSGNYNKINILERSLYLQHSAVWNKQFTLNAGVRFSHYLGDADIQTNAAQGINTRNTSHSLGATWQFHPDWQAFASRIESYNPSFGWDRNGKLFAPEQNHQTEIGLRYSRETKLNKPIEVQLSTYRLKRHNALTQDPLDPNALQATAEQLAKGVEVTLSAPLNQHVQLQAAYQHTNARIVQSNSYAPGNRLTNTPDRSASIKLDYQIKPQTQLNLSAVYVAKRAGDLGNSFEIPSYTRFDGGLTQQLDKNTTVTLGIRNMLNKDYIASSLDKNLLVQGRKRSVTLALESEF